MTDVQRGLFEAVRDGARTRARLGRHRVASWLRRLVPAAVALRAVVAASYFLAAELAVPPAWGSSALYLVIGAGAALVAALAPGGAAPLVATAVVVASWLVTTALDADHGGLWTALAVAVLLYTAHATAAVAQRFRTTTAVDGEIMLTWARHLGIVAASTAAMAGILALFTAYFAAIPAAVAVGIGVMASLTVIYVLARSLHNPSSK